MNFAGLFERATDEDPFKLDDRWVEARTTLNPMTVFNISSSNDITGGNSGSSLMNARGDIIGLIFDKSAYGLGSDEALDRSISVSVKAITEVLQKVYGADRIVQELRGEKS